MFSLSCRRDASFVSHIDLMCSYCAKFSKTVFIMANIRLRRVFVILLLRWLVVSVRIKCPKVLFMNFNVTYMF